MNFDEIIQKIKGVYYSWEDKYYDFLDGLEDQKIPVYKVIDPIDKVFPSFLLFLILIFLLGAALFFAALAVVFPGLFGGNVARFAVISQDAEPLAGIQVFLSFDDGTTENVVSDAFGEFSVQARTPEAIVEINSPDYSPFSERMELRTDTINEIVLTEKAGEGGKKQQRTLIMQDESGSALRGATIRFSCTNPVTPPATKLNASSTETILVDSTCGIVSATVSLAGHRDVTRTLTNPTTIFVLPRETGESIRGSIRVSVTDADSNDPVPGITLNLFASNSGRQDSGQSDGTGNHVFEAVPGNYYVRTNDPTGVYLPNGSEPVTIRAGQETSVEIALEKAAPGEIGKVAILVIDASSKEPIEGATVNLLEDGDQTALEVTNSLGIAEFPGLDTEKDYSVTVEHGDYIFKLVPGVPVFPPASSEKTTVELRGALQTNSGSVIVKVSDFAGNPIQGASVQLFDAAIEFAVRTGTTNNNGEAVFANMGPGAYTASASTLGQEGSSGEGQLTAGTDLILEITLIIREGGINATVVDSAGEPIEGASVEFVDSLTESLLESAETGAEGETGTLNFKWNIKPYLRISKEGYLPKTTAPFDLIPDDVIEPRIVLTSEEDLDNRKCDNERQFCLDLAGIFDSSGNRVTTLRENKDYVFRFKATAAEPVEGAKAAIIAGALENEPIEGAFVVIKSAGNARFAAVKYASFNPQNRFDESLGQTNAEGKYAVISLGNIERGEYEFPVTISVRQAEEDNALVEARYAALATIEGESVFVPETGWFRFSTNLGNVVPCNPSSTACENFIFTASLLSTGAVTDADYVQPVRLNTQDEFALREGAEYRLDFTVFNNHQSGTNFQDVTATFSTGNQGESAAVSFSPESLFLGELVNSLELDEGIGGSTFVRTIAGEGTDRMQISLGLNEQDDSVSYNVRVVPEHQLNVQPTRQTIPSDTELSLIVRVADSEGPVSGATVVWADNPQFTNPKPFSSSYVAQLPGLDAGTTIHIKATKAFYAAATATIEVVEADVTGEFSGQDFSCLKYEGEDIDFSKETIGTLILERGTTQNQFFRLSTNNCADNVNIALSIGALEAYKSKSITLTTTSFTLDKDGDSRRIGVNAAGAELSGHYDIIVFAKFANESSEALPIGIVETTATGKPEDLFILDKFKYDIGIIGETPGFDSGSFVNTAPADVRHFIFPDVSFDAQQHRQYFLEEQRFVDAPAQLEVEWKIVGKASDKVTEYIDLEKPEPERTFNPENRPVPDNISWFCSSSGDNCAVAGSFAVENTENADDVRLSDFWFSGEASLTINGEEIIPQSASDRCGSVIEDSSVSIREFEDPQNPGRFDYSVFARLPNVEGLDCPNGAYFGAVIRVESTINEIPIDSGTESVIIQPSDYSEAAPFEGITVDRKTIQDALAGVDPLPDNIEIHVEVPETSEARGVFDLWLDTSGNLDDGYPVMGQYLGEERELGDTIDFTIVNNNASGRNYDVIKAEDYVSGGEGEIVESTVSFKINGQQKTAKVLVDAQEHVLGTAGDGGFGIRPQAGQWKYEVEETHELVDIYFKSNGTRVVKTNESNPAVYASSSQPLHTSNKVNLAVLIDTSWSMNEEWKTVCNVIGDIESSMIQKGFESDIAIYGMDRARECAEAGMDWSGNVPKARNFFFPWIKYDSVNEAWGPTGLSAINTFQGDHQWENGARNILIIIGDNDPTGKASFDGTKNWRNETDDWNDNGTKDDDLPAEQQTAENLVNAALAKNISVFFLYPLPESMESKNISDYEGGDQEKNDAIELMELVASRTGGLTFNYTDTESDAFATQRFISIIQRASTQTASQNFHIRVDSGKQDLCYGRTVGNEVLVGFTGQSAVPRVLPTWNWKDERLGHDACSVFDPATGNMKNDFYYCDATQFTASLMKRLNMIKKEYATASPNFGKIDGLSTFQAWLIADGYTADFRGDFKEWMVSGSFFTVEDDYTSSDAGMRLLFENDDIAFSGPENLDSLPVSGRYEVTIITNFKTDTQEFFPGNGVSNAMITVEMRLIEQTPLSNLLYRVPLDGPVGLMEGTGSVDREGYGAGFSGAGFEALSLYSIGDNEVLTVSGSTGNPIAELRLTKDTSFNTLNAQLRGNLLRITQPAERVFDFTYTPSRPTAIAMAADNPASGSVDAFLVLDDGSEIVGNLPYLGVWDEFATTLESCRNFEGERLKKRLQDSPSSAAECPMQNAESARGFHWENAPQGTVFLRTVVYAPNLNYKVTNACTDAPTLIANRNQSTSASSLSLDAYSESRFDPRSLDTIFGLIKDKYMCVSVDSQTKETNFWWNPDKLYKDLRESSTVDLESACGFGG